MTLHLVKLCVGAELIADLEDWIARRVAERARRGETPRHAHVTRMAPKRAAELIDGGSLYWVIKGQLAARQRLLEVEPFVDADGVRRCRLWLDPEVTPVSAAADAAVSGLALFRAEGRAAGSRRRGRGAGAMPEELRRALGELGLL